MTRSGPPIVGAALMAGVVVAAALTLLSGIQPVSSDRVVPRRAAASEFGNLPLTFEANAGRTDPRV